MKKLFAFLSVVLLLVMACASSSPSPRCGSGPLFGTLSEEQRLRMIEGIEPDFESFCDTTGGITADGECPNFMYGLASLYDGQAEYRPTDMPEDIANDRKQAIELYRRLIREFPDFKGVPCAKKRLERLETLQPETITQE
jgi:hypothetical protein